MFGMTLELLPYPTEYGRFEILAGNTLQNPADREFDQAANGHELCAEFDYFILELETQAYPCFRVMRASNIAFVSMGMLPSVASFPFVRFYQLKVFGSESLSEQ